MGIADPRCDRRHSLGQLGSGGDGLPSPGDDQQLGQQDQPDHPTQRQVLQEPGTQFGEIDVQHHDHEHEQHRDRADVDHDQGHGQELRPQQHEQPGGVEERQDKEQHRMNGVLGRNDQHAGGDGDEGEHIERQGFDDHRAPPFTSPARVWPRYLSG